MLMENITNFNYVEEYKILRQNGTNCKVKAEYN